MRLDGFWIDTATELCRNTLGLLSFLPAHYTLQGLYSYLFDDEARETIQAELNPLLVTLEAKEQRLLKTYLRYHDTIFSNFDEKVKSGVNATVAQALSPFNHPELIDAFCEQSQTSLNMQSVLDGTVYLVDMPIARWGLGGKVAYTFIKLRFFNVMQNRIQHEDKMRETEKAIQGRVLSYFKRHGLLTSDEVLDMKTWQGSGGFSLHGNVLIEARDRKGLERLIRCCARPAFAGERLKSSADGEHLEYCFKERNLLGLPKRQKRWGLQRGAMQCSPLVAVRAGFPRRRKYNRKQSRSLAAEL